MVVGEGGRRGGEGGKPKTWRDEQKSQTDEETAVHLREFYKSEKNCQIIRAIYRRDESCVATFSASFGALLLSRWKWLGVAHVRPAAVFRAVCSAVRGGAMSGEGQGEGGEERLRTILHTHTLCCTLHPRVAPFRDDFPINFYYLLSISQTISAVFVHINYTSCIERII